MYNYEQDQAHVPPGPINIPQRMVFDGKRMRKPIQRRTVDYNSTIIKYLESRRYQRDWRDYNGLQPNNEYTKDLLPPSAMLHEPVSSTCTKFVHTSTNKIRCPINVVAWTPEGRRLITGSSSGEFTLWNGLTFNFETILQAHDTAVRAMIWSHNDNWMVTGDHSGTIKYWQSNMNNVKAFQAHKEAVRDICFAPTDLKMASCSDDVTIKIWDFARCTDEHVLTGHGWDVKSVAWHPQKSIIASGSKDNLVKIWDAKSGKQIHTLHGHKNTVLKVGWNQNGNWLLTAARDQLLKLFDVRTMRELQTFKAHKKEVTSIAWHPFHESMFVSGGFDGVILFWMVGNDEPHGEIAAHESSVWTLAWHPVGHILCSGSNDHTTKFWCRNRPGDTIKDKYNVQNKSAAETADAEADAAQQPTTSSAPTVIPGVSTSVDSEFEPPPKVPRTTPKGDVKNPQNGPPPPSSQQFRPPTFTPNFQPPTMPFPHMPPPMQFQPPQMNYNQPPQGFRGPPPPGANMPPLPPQLHGNGPPMMHPHMGNIPPQFRPPVAPQNFNPQQQQQPQQHQQQKH